ncbi:MAG: hypothetical protein ACUVQG_06395, partial [Thermogutta sp.]
QTCRRDGPRRPPRSLPRSGTQTALTLEFSQFGLHSLTSHRQPRLAAPGVFNLYTGASHLSVM